MTKPVKPEHVAPAGADHSLLAVVDVILLVAFMVLLPLMLLSPELGEGGEVRTFIYGLAGTAALAWLVDWRVSRQSPAAKAEPATEQPRPSSRPRPRGAEASRPRRSGISLPRA
jgi:hypothetical protein